MKEEYIKFLREKTTIILIAMVSITELCIGNMSYSGGLWIGYGIYKLIQST